MTCHSWPYVTKILAILWFVSSPILGTLYSQLSSLEIDLVEEGLAIFDVIPDENPENKLVRKIHVLTISPFTEDSGFLTIFNRLHWNSRDEVVRREILQKEGELYNPAAVRDSELALRAQSQVRSTAVIVPVRANVDESNATIDLLVVTRDLLSLHPTFNFKGSLDLITDVTVSIGEDNLFGYNKSIAAIYEMQQGHHIWSANYFDPRLFTSPLQLTIKPSIVFLRESFKFDGFMGNLKIEKPLLSESDMFGYGADLSYNTRSVIDFNGRHVRLQDIPTAKGIQQIERKYRWRNGKGSFFTRFSFGRLHKKEFFIRYGFNAKRPSIPENVVVDEEKRQFILKNLLPRNEFESYVTLGVSYFQNKFLTLYDYDNFKLQELKRIGPTATLSNDFSLKSPLFSDHDFLRPESKFTFMQPLYKDSFAYVSASTSNRFDGSFTDNTYKFGTTLVSPKILSAARVVFDARFSLIKDNRDNQKFVLGADSGIRGVESRTYSGDIGFRLNLELRSAPVDLWIFHIGAVLFYDVGSAFNEWKKANPTHALGLGLRFLAPQLSAIPFRVDLAFPIYGKGKEQHVVLPSFGLGQAF